MNLGPYLFILVGLIAAAAFCGLLLRFWKFRSGWDAGDLVRKRQRKPVLRLGGVGIALAAIVVVAALVWFGPEPGSSKLQQPWLLLGSAMLFFLIGSVDDLRSLPALLKLGLQVLAATLVFLAGFRIEMLGGAFSDRSVELHGLSYPVTVFWLLAIPNLINFADGIDGVAGGIAAALLGTLSAVSFFAGDLPAAFLCLGLVGAVLGFLCFNLPRARLYMGDGGAYFLGAIIAVLSINVSQKGAVTGALLVVVVALALPLADAVFAVLRRAFYGFPVWKADSEHLHHRLVTLGIRKGVVIGGLIGGVALLSVLGLGAFVIKGHTAPVLGTIGILLVVTLTRFFGHWGGVKGIVAHFKRSLITRERVRYAYALSLVLEHELDRVEDAGDFWTEMTRAMAKVGLFPGRGPGESAAETRSDAFSGASLQEMKIELAGGGVWHLRHFDTGKNTHWGKVVTCFTGPLCRGVRKLGHPPEEIGLDFPENAPNDAVEDRELAPAVGLVHGDV